MTWRRQRRCNSRRLRSDGVVTGREESGNRRRGSTDGISAVMLMMCTSGTSGWCGEYGGGGEELRGDIARSPGMDGMMAKRIQWRDFCEK